jgi:sortase (surface protein transpeptidase)
LDTDFAVLCVLHALCGESFSHQATCLTTSQTMKIDPQITQILLFFASVTAWRKLFSGQLTLIRARCTVAHKFVHAYQRSVLVGLLLLCTACQAEPAPATPTVRPLPTATATPGLSVTRLAPLSPAQAHPPVRLAIPAIDLSTAITPMAWQVTEVDGQRRAVWQVPLDSAGWHLNSAGAGAAGNVVISGQHRLGAAVFAALARGQVQIGQAILLTDDQGQTFVYEVTQIADPIPALGANDQEQARAAAFLAPSDQAQMTLVTGWPEFSDTHLLFVVAHLMGALASPTQHQ